MMEPTPYDNLDAAAFPEQTKETVPTSYISSDASTFSSICPTEEIKDQKSEPKKIWDDQFQNLMEKYRSLCSCEKCPEEATVSCPTCKIKLCEKCSLGCKEEKHGLEALQDYSSQQLEIEKKLERIVVAFNNTVKRDVLTIVHEYNLPKSAKILPETNDDGVAGGRKYRHNDVLKLSFMF